MMTGNITQFTIDIVNWISSNTAESRAKLMKSGSVVSGFVFGAAMGALGFSFCHFLSVLFPVAIIYYIYSREIACLKKRHKEE